MFMFGVFVYWCIKTFLTWVPSNQRSEPDWHKRHRRHIRTRYTPKYSSLSLTERLHFSAHTVKWDSTAFLLSAFSHKTKTNMSWYYCNHKIRTVAKCCCKRFSNKGICNITGTFARRKCSRFPFKAHRNKWTRLRHMLCGEMKGELSGAWPSHRTLVLLSALCPFCTLQAVLPPGRLCQDESLMRLIWFREKSNFWS